MPKKREDLTGRKFTRLTVVSFHSSKRSATRWNCLCDCGNTTVSIGASLKKGTSKSCGCYAREKRKEAKTHGMSNSVEYSTWVDMKQRCQNPNNINYKRYGDRGISVCDEWSSFSNFYYDMGDRPDDEHSIERVDNSGNYCAENCRWVLRSEQQNNMRSNRLITCSGFTATTTEWAKFLRIPYSLLRYRVTQGWPDEAIIKGK